MQDRDVLHGVIDTFNTMDSSRNMAKARHMLSECVSSHAMCQMPAIDFAPSRLLEVSPDPGQTHIRLFETDPSRQQKWASLSYVWGTAQPHKTTKRRLIQYMGGICIADLPQTIRDAVTVCRELHIPNLWVDSLCIVQDDMMDMTRELPLMAEIYRHSLVTISAACARSVTDGFLHTKGFVCYGWSAPTALLYQASDGSKTKALALVEENKTKTYYSHNFTDPIDKRAWALQERLLSPRLLTYSSHGIIWSCRSLYSTDYQRELRQQDFGEFDRGRGTTSIPCIPGLKMQPWEYIVQQYSDQEMTLTSDKLIALSAIAQTYSQTGDDYGTYLAGLWKEMMPNCLMWYGPWNVSRCRLVEYRAPSWSWASVDGPVKWSGYRMRLHSPQLDVAHAEVMIAETTPAVEGFPFGAVIDGTLVLYAETRRCYIKRIKKHYRRLRVVKGPELTVWEDTDDFRKARAMNDGGTDVLLLKMGYERRYNESWKKFVHEAVGLVLVKTSGGNYRRVAVFRCDCRRKNGCNCFSGSGRERITII